MVNAYKNQRMIHLSDYEAFLAKQFLDEQPDKFFNFNFDVHIPIPQNWPKILEGAHLKNAIDLSALRIDFTAESKNQIFIIEVRPNASMSAPSQLLAYRILYNLTFNPRKAVGLCLITDLYKKEVELVCRELQILYWVYRG